MKEANKKYIDYDEYLKKEEKNLDNIYNDLLEDNEDKNAIKKFDRIVKSNIDYKGILPCSKSYQGESLLTLSKTWMIIILLKINKGRAQQDQFLTLVNSSLTHELNEYEEYRNFFNDQCELLFSEEEAIKGINFNPKLPKKLSGNISHEDLRNYYIYLLFKPQYFQKNDLEQMPKPQKRKYEKKEMERSKSKSNKSKNDNKKSINDEDIYLESENDSENDEKGDRLDENDMISKNRTKLPKKKVSEKNKKTTNTTKEKINKRKNEKDDKDYITINNIINKKNKSENKEDKKKKKKSMEKSYIEDEDIDMEDISETKKEKENKNKNKKKVSINEKKKNKNVKKKYEEESEEEDEEEKITDKKKKNKKKEKEKENKSGKGKNKKEEKQKNKTSANKIFELLGIDSNLIEEEEEEDDEDKKEKEKKKKKERKTISVPPKKKKEKSSNKTKKESSNKRDKEKKEDNNKEKKDKRKNKKKTKKSKSDIDDEDEFLSDEDIINSLTDLKDSDTSDEYGVNLDEDENKKMQREIDAALDGNLDELDLEEILGDSELGGISLSQLESKSKSSLDLGSFEDES